MAIKNNQNIFQGKLNSLDDVEDNRAGGRGMGASVEK